MSNLHDRRLLAAERLNALIAGHLLRRPRASQTINALAVVDAIAEYSEMLAADQPVLPAPTPPKAA